MALKRTAQRRTLQGIGNSVLLLMVLWTAIPFYWMIATSISARARSTASARNGFRTIVSSFMVKTIRR